MGRYKMKNWFMKSLITLLALILFTASPIAYASKKSDTVANTIVQVLRNADEDFVKNSSDDLERGIHAIAKAMTKIESDDVLRSAKGAAIANRVNELIAEGFFTKNQVEDLMRKSADLVKFIDDRTPQLGQAEADRQLRELAITFSRMSYRFNNASDPLYSSKGHFAEINSLGKKLDDGSLKMIQPSPPNGDHRSYREAIFELPDGTEVYLEVKHWPKMGYQDFAVDRLNSSMKAHFERLNLNSPGEISINEINELTGIRFEFELPAEKFVDYKDKIVPRAIKEALNPMRPEGVPKAQFEAAVQNYISNKISVEAFAWD